MPETNQTPNPLSPLLITKEVFATIRQNFWRLLVLLFLPSIFTFALIFLGSYAISPTYYSLRSGNYIDENFLLLLLVIFLIAFIFVSIVFSFAWSLTTCTVLLAYRNTKAPFGFILKKGLKKTFAWFWTSYLLLLITNTGYSFLIFPGIIFNSWFFAAEFLAVNEKTWGAEAIDRSRKIVGNNWKWAFVNVLIADVFFWIVYYLVIWPEKIIRESTGSELTIIYLFTSFSLAFVVQKIYKYILYEKIVESNKQRNIELTSEKNLKTINNISCGCGILVAIFLIAAMIFLASNWSNTTTFKNKINDNKIETAHEDTTDALKKYFDANGFYPPNDHIEYLWEGNKTVIEKKPDLPEECGINNEKSKICGLEYTSDPVGRSYLLVPHYIEKEKQKIK